MKFTPLKFQAPLAAGGIALMAFNFLQFAVPHGKGSIKLSDIPWAELTMSQTIAYIPLTLIMLAFASINMVLTIVFLKELVQWLLNNNDYQNFMNDPFKNMGIFAPVASLSMTVNVIWASLAFFVPKLSTQGLMMPSLIFFGFLWLVFFMLEFKVLKIWLTQTIDVSKLNFVWLLDVFALGLVNLTGTGIAAISADKGTASLAAFASSFGLSIGIFLLIIKLTYLIYLQIKSTKLPDKPVLPAYFLIIPITCLYGLSLYRIMMYLQTYFSFDVKVSSFFLITFSYAVTIGWGAFTLYLLYDYFRKDFSRSEFSPPQWAMVWGLVGSQVLGVYVYGNYYPSLVLSVMNYASVVLASIIYVIIFAKFHRANRKEKYSKLDTACIKGVWSKMMQWGFGFGGFGMFIWWILIIGVVVVFFYQVGNRGSNDDRSYNLSNNAMEILKERYAKGELTEEEYKKMRRDLQEWIKIPVGNQWYSLSTPIAPELAEAMKPV